MCSRDLDSLISSRRTLLETLELDLRAASTFGSVAGVGCPRDIIKNLKQSWSTFSAASTSLRSAQTSLGNIDAAKRLRTERKLLAARIEEAVMDLNDGLRGLGEELESSFCNSISSSLSDTSLDHRVEALESGRTFLMNEESLIPSVSSCDFQVSLSSSYSLGRTSRGRNILAPEHVIANRLEAARRDLRRLLVSSTVAGTPSPCLAQKIFRELDVAFRKYTEASVDAADFHR